MIGLPTCNKTQQTSNSKVTAANGSGLTVLWYANIQIPMGYQICPQTFHISSDCTLRILGIDDVMKYQIYIADGKYCIHHPNKEANTMKEGQQNSKPCNVEGKMVKITMRLTLLKQQRMKIGWIVLT